MLLSQTTTQRENLEQALYESVLRHCLAVKKAGDETHYSLSGRLYLASNGYLLLSVPNAVAKGLFDALDEQGVELPLKDGRLNAHITVMSPDEVEQLGGPEKITERGHAFRYNLGPVKTVKPSGWANVSKVWFCSVSSPDLQTLRKAYGLSPLPKDGKHKFHITFAIRKSGVLQNNETKKAASFRMQELVENKPVFLMNELVKKAELPPSRQKKRKLPLWLYPAAGLGAAGIGGAYALGSDEHSKIVREQLAKQKEPYGENETSATRYQNLMGAAAASTPVGVPVGELLSRARTQNWLLKLMGIQNPEQYGTTAPGAFMEAKHHYNSFKKGPIASYEHQMGHTGRGAAVIPESAYPADYKGPKNLKYWEALKPYYYDAFKKLIAKKYPGGDGWLEPQHIDQKVLPFKEQVEFLDDFQTKLPPWLQKVRKDTENEKGMKDTYEAQTKNYGGITKAILDARDSLKTVGYTSGGAAAGGAAGHYLYNWLTRNRKNKPANWLDNLGYYATTLGGAGLGGAAMYYGASKPGTEAVGNAIKNKTKVDVSELPKLLK